MGEELGRESDVKSFYFHQRLTSLSSVVSLVVHNKTFILSLKRLFN